MTQPKRKPITDDELIELIGRLPAAGAAMGTVLLRLVSTLLEININIQHIAAAIDDHAKSIPSTASIDRLVAAVDKLGAKK
jgi:hypothetical protein